MSQPPPPPRRRTAPVVIYPGSPPPPGGSAGQPTEARRAPVQQPSGGSRRPDGANGNGRGNRRRPIIIAAAVLGVIVLAGGAFALLSGGGDSGPTFKASTAVDLAAGETKVEGVGATPPAFPPQTRDQILSSIGTYVEDGIVKPLRTGKADGPGLATVFDAPAAARLTGPDRAVLIDEGLPKAVGKVTVTTPAVAMTALADGDGSLKLVSANVDFKVKARAAKGTVTIQRTGSFVFAPDDTGAWKITGWTLNVTRGGSALPASETPTTKTAPTTTAGQ